MVSCCRFESSSETEMNYESATGSPRITGKINFFFEIDENLIEDQDFFSKIELPVHLKRYYPQLSQEKIDTFPFKTLLVLAPNDWDKFCTLIEQPLAEDVEKNPVAAAIFSEGFNHTGLQEILAQCECRLIGPFDFTYKLGQTIFFINSIILILKRTKTTLGQSSILFEWARATLQLN